MVFVPEIDSGKLTPMVLSIRERPDRRLADWWDWWLLSATKVVVAAYRGGCGRRPLHRWDSFSWSGYSPARINQEAIETSYSAQVQGEEAFKTESPFAHSRDSDISILRFSYLAVIISCVIVSSC